VIIWTERPDHRHWLLTETRRLLDFGRGAVPTDITPIIAGRAFDSEIERPP